MERNVALQIAINEMGMEEKAAKKHATAQLTKKVERFMAERAEAEERARQEVERFETPAPINTAPKKRGRKPNPNKIVRQPIERGEFVLGWETPTGNRRILKYGPITRNGEPFQVIHDQELNPEKVAKCHWYKKRNAAEKNLAIFMEQNPSFYAGLQVLTK